MASSDKLINVEHGEKETILRIGDYAVTWDNSILVKENLGAIAQSIEHITNKYTNTQDNYLKNLGTMLEKLYKERNDTDSKTNHL